MRLIGNILWLIFAGWGLFLGWVIAGLLLCITIIGIPFGTQAFKIAAYTLWPFGRSVVPRESAGAGSVLLNVLWIVLAGWWLALLTIISGVLLCVTIIGIPLGIAAFKMLPIVFSPFGSVIVHADSPDAARGFAIGR